MESEFVAQPSLLFLAGIRWNHELDEFSLGAIKHQVLNVVTEFLPGEIEIKIIELGQGIERIAGMIVRIVVKGFA